METYSSPKTASEIFRELLADLPASQPAQPAADLGASGDEAADKYLRSWGKDNEHSDQLWLVKGVTTYEDAPWPERTDDASSEDGRLEEDCAKSRPAATKRKRLSAQPRTVTLYVSPALRLQIEAAAKPPALREAALTFASWLHLGVHEFDDYLPLNSKISREIYTSRLYGPMLRMLDQAGALERRSKGAYSVGRFCKSYRLAERYHVTAEPVEILSPNLQSRLRERAERKSYAQMQGKARSWIVQAYKAASFDADLGRVLDQIAQKGAATLNFAHHITRLVHEHALRFSVSRESGRVYYPIASLPKVIRPLLQIDGASTVEIDAAASQPTLLATLYPNDSVERARYLTWVLEEDFYDRIAAIYPSPLTRSEAKRTFFREIAFGSAFAIKNYPLWAPFAERFPELASLMLTRKRVSKSALPVAMQKLEAQITIDSTIGECATHRIPVLPVHDALICKKSDAKTVEELLARSWKKHTGIDVRLRTH